MQLCGRRAEVGGARRPHDVPKELVGLYKQGTMAAFEADAGCPRAPGAQCAPQVVGWLHQLFGRGGEGAHVVSGLGPGFLELIPVLCSRTVSWLCGC